MHRRPREEKGRMISAGTRAKRDGKEGLGREWREETEEKVKKET